MDDMMVESNDDIDSSLKETHFPVWLGMAQVFVPINEGLDSPEADNNQERQPCFMEKIGRVLLCSIL